MIFPIIYLVSNAMGTKIEGVPIPVLVYHSVLDSRNGINKWAINKDDLRKNFEYIKEQGYTTILSQDIYDYINNKKPLPKKPIIITFDDGLKNNLTLALPLLKEYNMKAIFNIVGDYCSYGIPYMNWEELKVLQASGRAEIGSHSYNFHKNNGLIGLSFSSITKDLSKFQMDTVMHGLPIPKVFAYPFGSVNKNVIENVSKTKLFKITFSCRAQVNYITDWASVECMGRFNVHGRNSMQILKDALEVKKNIVDFRK